MLISDELDIPICLQGAAGSCQAGPVPSYLRADADCVLQAFAPAYPGCARINGEGPVAIESHSWSPIKSLYRD